MDGEFRALDKCLCWAEMKNQPVHRVLVKGKPLDGNVLLEILNYVLWPPPCLQLMLELSWGGHGLGKCASQRFSLGWEEVRRQEGGGLGGSGAQLLWAGPLGWGNFSCVHLSASRTLVGWWKWFSMPAREILGRMQGPALSPQMAFLLRGPQVVNKQWYTVTSQRFCSKIVQLENFCVLKGHPY
jgi:hypothetical protein